MLSTVHAFQKRKEESAKHFDAYRRLVGDHRWVKQCRHWDNRGRRNEKGWPAGFAGVST